MGDEPKLVKVDLGCGQNKQPGFIGVDYRKIDGVDVVHDLEVFPWPFEDNAVDEVHCSHYVEHTPDLIKFMDELYRIMKEGAKATIIAPYYSSMRAWQDPTHKRAISEASFLYFNKGWRDQNGLSHYNIKSDFDFSYGYAIDPTWGNRSEEARGFAIKHYWNVVNDIQVTLTKREIKEEKK
jgi:ubiquinone/menaquinone biosynthesis C-methylase UbiE